MLGKVYPVMLEVVISIRVVVVVLVSVFYLSSVVVVLEVVFLGLNSEDARLKVGAETLKFVAGGRVPTGGW